MEDLARHAGDPGRRTRGPDRRQAADEPVIASEDAFGAGEAVAFGGIERRRRPRRKEDVRQRLRDQWAVVQTSPWRRGIAAEPVPVIDHDPETVIAVIAVIDADLDAFALPARSGLRLLAEVPLVRVSLALTLHGLSLARQLLRSLG